MSSFPVFSSKIPQTLLNWAPKIVKTSNLAELLSKIILDPWQAWNPTYTATGAMTFTGTTTEISIYKIVGPVVIFSVRASGTTGGVASTGLEFTLPVTAANTFGGTFTAVTVDGAGVISATAILATQEKVVQGRYDGANYGLGAGRFISCAGIYQRLE